MTGALLIAAAVALVLWLEHRDGLLDVHEKEPTP